jgi:hypothetical protein
MEGDPVSLKLGPTMEAIETGPAPVVVGIVGVYGKLKENLRILPRVGCPEDEVATTFGGPAVAMNEFASPVLRPEQNLVVTAFPVRGYGHLEPYGPFASMGGGILGNGAFGTADAGLGKYGFHFGSVSFDLNPVLLPAGRGMQLELFPRSVAKLTGIALDIERTGFVGEKVEGAKERQSGENNGFFHRSIIKVVFRHSLRFG